MMNCLNQVFLKVEEPSGLAHLCKFLENEFLPSRKIEIHSTAFIDPGAKIGKNVSIGAFCFIGKGVCIGDNTTIGPIVILEIYLLLVMIVLCSL